MPQRKLRGLTRPRHDAATIDRFKGKISDKLFRAAHAGTVHASAEHIGQALHIPTGTAKSRLHRATTAIDMLLAAERLAPPEDFPNA
jgi:hypothetical protein